jgi:hypothetical protein
MRIARKLLLLVITAIAATALMASTASAQESVEVVNEATGAHCGALGSGNECEAQWRDEISFINHVFGIETTIYDCQLTLATEIDEDGQAEVDVSFFAHSPASSCNPQACDEPWSAQFHEEPSGLAMEVEICYQLSGGGSKMRCLFDFPLTNAVDHAYGLTTTDVSAVTHENAQCEYNGSLALVPSSPDDIEFLH